jgi:hypothetical protein
MVETGPLLDAPVRFTAPVESEVEGELSPETAEKARRMRGQFRGEGVQRTALLGVLLARLEGVPFDGTATLLNVRERRLEKLMHGEESIPRSFEGRWESLARILEDLHAVLRPQATWKWFNTRIPELDNRTPFEAIKKGRLDAVSAVAHSYRDPSFR